MTTQIPPKDYLPERLHAQADELAELRFRAHEARGKVNDLKSETLTQRAEQADDALLVDAKDPAKVGSPNVAKLRQERLQAQRASDMARAAAERAEKAFSAALTDSTAERAELAKARAESLAPAYSQAVDTLFSTRGEYIAAVKVWNQLLTEDVQAEWQREKDRLGIEAVPGGFSWPNWRPDGPRYTDRVPTRGYENTGIPKTELLNILKKDARSHEVVPGNKPSRDPFGFEALARIGRGEDA